MNACPPTSTTMANLRVPTIYPTTSPVALESAFKQSHNASGRCSKGLLQRFKAHIRRLPPKLAALCTDDVIQIGPKGPTSGRQAIGKKYVDLFRQSHPGNIICTTTR